MLAHHQEGMFRYRELRGVNSPAGCLCNRTYLVIGSDMAQGAESMSVCSRHSTTSQRVSEEALLLINSITCIISNIIDALSACEVIPPLFSLLLPLNAAATTLFIQG